MTLGLKVNVHQTVSDQRRRISSFSGIDVPVSRLGATQLEEENGENPNAYCRLLAEVASLMDRNVLKKNSTMNFGLFMRSYAVWSFQRVCGWLKQSHHKMTIT